MPERDAYPYVGRSGYRVSSPLDPGMRSKLTTKPRPHPPTAKPLDVGADELARRARIRAGFGS